MATKFLEPGGDATFNVDTTTAGGFWGGGGGCTVVTDIIHGTHIKSIKPAINGGNIVRTPNGVVADSGSRISFYLYINALPTTSTAYILTTRASGSLCQAIVVTTAGVLQMRNSISAQIGSNGPTLSTGQWYRISLAYTVTSSSVNRFELFVDSISGISITNASSVGTGANQVEFGYQTANTTFDTRFSDIYVDDSNTLTDTGNIWVTAKRPNANGTANDFSTQIGVGGSGYGSGHSPQVNERSLSITNGWSMVGAGSAVTEEYNIESISIGDINIIGSTIIDIVGWAYMKSLVAETVQMIIDGVNFAQAITSTTTLYTNFANQATFPSSTGADIGITTDTSLTTVSLYECGIVVAYFPCPGGYSNSGSRSLATNRGLATNRSLATNRKDPC